jgi:sugar phosphate isomerase/epimerase
MQLSHGLHLAYCTNIHRGEDWAETFASLQKHTLAVKRQVCPKDAYAIGLRLSNRAAMELKSPSTLKAFREWLDRENCYVFTINGFPYGQFHGTRVKEQVYLPDWSSPERVAYTNLLFDLLAEMLPPGLEGSVSTVPCGFKEPPATRQKWNVIRKNIFSCVEHIAALSERSGKLLHLGLEPEPLCLLETTTETIEFFASLRSQFSSDERIARHLGVNYDACHLAVEFEEPAASIAALRRAGIRISKFHLSSALRVNPISAARSELRRFCDPVYFHQVISGGARKARLTYRDLDEALADREGKETDDTEALEEEWRIHFHVPLHSPDNAILKTTIDHLRGVLDILASDPGICSHLEMETYTWETMPPEMRTKDVVSQLVEEYRWTLAECARRGLWNGPIPSRA